MSFCTVRAVVEWKGKKRNHLSNVIKRKRIIYFGTSIQGEICFSSEFAIISFHFHFLLSRRIVFSFNVVKYSSIYVETFNLKVTHLHNLYYCQYLTTRQKYTVLAMSVEIFTSLLGIWSNVSKISEKLMKVVVSSKWAGGINCRQIVSQSLSMSQCPFHEIVNTVHIT